MLPTRFNWIAKILCLLVSLACSPAQAQQWQWKKIAGYPDPVGVASPFAGQSHAAFLVAGGANFPDKKPWEGGKKVWHDSVYALDRSDGSWKTVGRLPRPLAYGVGAAWNDSVVCAGGSDANQHVKDVFQMRYSNSKLTFEPLADLPVRLANACGAIVDGVLIISGGLQHPDSSKCESKTWALDLSAPDSNTPVARRSSQWQELAELPARPRMLSTAASNNESLWIIGGVTLVNGPDGKPAREYLRECWKLEFNRKSMTGRWVPQADLPVALAANPGPAIANDGIVWIFGGDDGTQVGVGPSEHRGFSTNIYTFDIAKNRWSESSQKMPFSRVTVPMAAGFGGWVIPSGEAKPGIRSSDVWWIGQ